mmetsp:Transcript_69552/g.201512  ORF Transcript_69552/g.201512 Transcript_69552/m.201512 type:complete len:95 (+) Transcript_69552:143-427(+)
MLPLVAAAATRGTSSLRVPQAVLAVLLSFCLLPRVEAIYPNPACWISWRMQIEEGDEVIEGDACMLNGWVTLVNVVCFYLVFLLLIRTLILATQ